MLQKNLFNKLSLYWICQLLGWGSAAAYWSYYQIRPGDGLLLGVISVIIPFFGGIVSTHAYKVLAHRHKWIDLELKQLLPILFFALIALTAAYLVFAISCALVRYGDLGINSFLGMFTGGLRYNSIWLLAFHLYHYARYSRQAEIDQSNYEKLAIAAQLQRLNTELNPHFLFNSLNSIKALILENPSDARKAVDLLSNLLRNALQHSGKSFISLEDELASIETYLAMEKIRFEDRLHYQLDVPTETRIVPIPPLSLYNLVENAVKHGISNSKDGGQISIKARASLEFLTLEVVNDGCLQRKNENGIGIKNVSERLRLAYGSAARLRLEALNEDQVCSSLILPLRP